MLLELRALSESMQAAGITGSRSANQLVPYPNRPALLVLVDSSGQVAGVSALPDDRRRRLVKYESSKGGSRESSPGFNIDPLYCPRSDEDQKEFSRAVGKLQSALKKGANLQSDARKTGLTNLFARSDAGWGESRKKAVNLCLKRAADALRTALGEATDANLEPLCELLRRSALLDAGRLYAALDKHLRAVIVDGEAGSSPELLVQVLFAKEASVVLELADRESFAFPANHEEVWEAVNRRLLASERAPKGNTTSIGQRCGLFGEPVPDSLPKMPERNVPRLGKVKLRSMSRSAVCQGRYGLIEAEACPLGPELQAGLASALEWITAEEREFATWADVSDSCGFDKPALLIAYPTRMPAQLSWLSGLLASGDDSSGPAEQRFESFARTVTERLNGLVKEDPRTAVAVFVLLKADKARTKVLYSRQFAAGRVLAAAEEWQGASRNLPRVLIRTFGENRRPHWVEPQTPFPAQLVRCLNTAWQRGGTEAKRVSGPDIGTGLTLLLETGDALLDAARRGLRQALANGTSLILALGAAHARGQVHRVPLSQARVPVLLPCCLGLLLAKVGSLKGEYMNRNPYLIGRLLSLADKLHWNYCRVERKGEQPPQLLGNSLMPTALENPVAGLARLSERLPLYLRCAGGGMRQEVAEVECAIDKADLPTRCSDEDKAQMLLGYLARPDVEADAEKQPPETGESP